MWIVRRSVSVRDSSGRVWTVSGRMMLLQWVQPSKKSFGKKNSVFTKGKVLRYTVNGRGDCPGISLSDCKRPLSQEKRDVWTTYNKIQGMSSTLLMLFLDKRSRYFMAIFA
ncbi:unnamed protein product [Absidia cylindrospora]